MSKFSRNFFRDSKKRKLKKGREKSFGSFGKFYFKFGMILNKIWKQILNKWFYEARYKIKKEEVTDNY